MNLVRRSKRMRLCLALGVGLSSLAAAQPSRAVASVRTISAVAAGDEPIVVTEHRIDTVDGPLAYEARAGRLAIRDSERGEVRGYIFFVAYHALNKGSNRPITFAWNGGPTVASWIVHSLGLGPRLRRPNGFIDNPQTLLADSDLVFMDAMETGFSRPAKPEFAPEFLQFQGDVAATVEFIRSYGSRFRTKGQPLFIAGESYGVFRAAAVADELSQRGIKIAGTVLISGDIPNIPQPIPFYDAMHVPARAATAFYYKRLPPELMRDRSATIREVVDWARNVYQPALTRKEELSNTARDTIARQLARYTGIDDSLVSRKTLVVDVRTYLSQFFGGDLSRHLDGHDTRSTGDFNYYGTPEQLDAYMRDELHYTTDLSYRGIERGYSPIPGPAAKSSAEQFYYNQPGMTEAAMQAVLDTGEVNTIAQINPPWIVDALKRDRTMQLFVATGRFDPLNMCEGDQIATATLPADLAGRISNHCYESGHVIYADEAARLAISRDLSAFVRQAAARQPAVTKP